MKTIFLASMAALTLGTASAQAATYAYVYAATNNSAPFAASGRFTTLDTPNGLGTYDITSITGFVDSDAIVALTPNPGQPGVSPSPSGLFNFDNVYTGTAQILNPGGPLFTSASFEYNLFYNSPGVYELYQANSGGYTANSVGTLMVSRVPEPASWALMLTGLGLTGLHLRRRSRVVTN